MSKLRLGRLQLETISTRDAYFISILSIAVVVYAIVWHKPGWLAAMIGSNIGLALIEFRSQLKKQSSKNTD